MLALLLLASALPQPFVSSAVEKPVPSPGVSTSLDTNGDREVRTALDAERAFAADAQKLGQWTAFRKWAASDATMFVPQPINAQAWLKDRKDPAKAIDWWPTASYVSCDGSLAVNTGGWKRPNGAVGYFSTVWQRQPDGGWKWIVDSGDLLLNARPHLAKPPSQRASCERNQAFLPTHTHVPPDGVTLPPEGRGYANDSSIAWYWTADANGNRRLTVSVAGQGSPVIDDKITAPK